MRTIDSDKLDQLPGIRLKSRDIFKFRCHAELGCFNRCCRNLNLFLYPYDVLRLKNALGISSDELLDHHVDVVLRDSNHFPDVLLRMADNDEKTCPFLAPSGCSVYPHRPDTCRTFPVEHGVRYDDDAGKTHPVYFFRPPDFCAGQFESREWTVDSWANDQDAVEYNRFTTGWSEIKWLFRNDPWGAEGPGGAKGKMAFMATYNIDRFREFVLGSSFLARYRVKSKILKKMRADEREMLKFGFDWVKFFLWGIKSKKFNLR
ncbi:MAG: YkgJ family cysteine cluster protein [Desulfobacteraceae bacterium]|nr:YkgJ family cysteine cluster protein [Desulfobacteraceae bacterium]